MPEYTVTELCVSCHSKGAGADTAVMEGAVIEASDGGVEPAKWPRLLGGGFTMVGNQEPVTGSHMLLATAAPYGSAVSGSLISLECVSCHTPHDGPNYRLLRQQPGDITGTLISVPWNAPPDVTTTDPDGKTITVKDYAYAEQSFGTGIVYDPATRTFSGTSAEVTRNYRAGIAEWCTACHSRYMTRSDLEAYDAGDAEGATPRYRHAVGVPIKSAFNHYLGATVSYDFQTDLPLEDKGNTGTGAIGRTDDDAMTCLTCHKAHGSSAVMTGSAVLASDGDRGSLPADTNSMLLRLNNRQVCQTACHRVVN
jgi:cytochrome c553